MSGILECIVNISAGQNSELIEKITSFLQSSNGVELLHVDSGFDVNRTVFTFFVSEEEFINTGFRFIQQAQRGIDMREQAGHHPRVGAVDVFPVVAFSDITKERALELTNSLAEKVGRELQTPIYLYEHSQNKTHRSRLEQIRKGGYEAMAERMSDPNWIPDYGPKQFNERTGVTVMGVRDILLAVNFTIPNLTLAQGKIIAGKIRTSGRVITGHRLKGKFKNLKAIAWLLPRYHHIQVSTNITNHKQTPLHRVFDEVNLLAIQYGSGVIQTEVIGMLPKSAFIKFKEKILNC